MCRHLPRLHVGWGTRLWHGEPGAGLTGRSQLWMRIGPKTQRPSPHWSGWSLPTPEGGSVSFRRDRVSCIRLDFCNKKKKKRRRIIYIRVLITPEFQKRENTFNGFCYLLDQTQTKEKHVDCSCAELSTQAELQPLNDVLWITIVIKCCLKCLVIQRLARLIIEGPSSCVISCCLKPLKLTA